MADGLASISGIEPPGSPDRRIAPGIARHRHRRGPPAPVSRVPAHCGETAPTRCGKDKLHVLVRLDLEASNGWSDEVPEESPHTSVTTRVEHAKAQGRTSDLKAAEQGSVAGSTASAGLEEAIWLCPVGDRRKLDSWREGMMEGLPLGSYLLLVDYTGRLFREGKSAISAELAGILARLDTSVAGWQARLETLKGGRLLGRFLAGSRKRYFRGSERRLLRSPPVWACTTWQTSASEQPRRAGSGPGSAELEQEDRPPRRPVFFSCTHPRHLWYARRSNVCRTLQPRGGGREERDTRSGWHRESWNCR